MSIVWITAGLSVLPAVAVLICFLPAFRTATLGWRLLGASGVSLSILGVNFIIRFWTPTVGPYRANELYPFGGHLHAWAVSFGFTWIAFGLLFAVFALSVSRTANHTVWIAMFVAWLLCWIPHGIIGVAFASAGKNAPSVATYRQWSANPRGFALLLFNMLALAAHFGCAVAGFWLTRAATLRGRRGP